nr:12343_t:CDS:2 [Entrophospora candida]
MNGKITEIEFKDWSGKIRQLGLELILNSGHLLFRNKQEEEDFKELLALLKVYIDKGEIESVFFGQQVFQRLKEHCIANGYYDPNSPPDLALLKQRMEKALKKIIGDKYKEFIKEDQDIPRDFDFLAEDYIGRLEKLISLKEQAESQNTPPPTSYQNNLEREIKELERQVKDLERLLGETSNSSQEGTYKRLLEIIRGDLEEKRKNNNPSQNQPDSNKKLIISIAIGVGAATIAIILISLVAIAANKKREEY